MDSCSFSRHRVSIFAGMLEMLALFGALPASVGVAFGKSVVRQFDLFRIANDLGVRLVIGTVAAVEPDRKRVILADGSPIAYRALLIASGGAAREAIPGAVTFRGPADVDS